MSCNLIKSIGLAAAIVLLLAPSTILADVLILKSGDEISGRFANRQLLRTDPFSLRHVAIDVGGGGATNIRTYSFDDVQYLVFEAPDGERDVIDLWAARDAPAAPITKTIHDGWPPQERQVQVSSSGAKSPAVGAALMGVGAASVLVGLLKKFGGNESYLYLGNATTPREYNAANWIVVGAGSFLVLLGVYELATRNTADPGPVFGGGGGDNGAAGSTGDIARRDKSKTSGAVLMGLGLTAVGVGAFVPFGEDELVITADEIKTEKQRNPANWLTVGAGTLLFVLGVYELSSAQSDAPRPVFGWRGGDDMNIGVAVNF